MSSLTQEQLDTGVPVSTPHTGVIDTTRYLPLTFSKANVPSDAYYTLSPLLEWKGCLASADKAFTGTPDLDLESVALSRLSDKDKVGGAARLFTNASQGSINMCTSMAFVHAYALKYVLQRVTIASEDIPQLSPVYAYYFQRIEECEAFDICACTQVRPLCPNKDSTCSKCDPPCLDCGSYLTSAAVVFSRGVASSTLWPYTSDINTPPSDEARSD